MEEGQVLDRMLAKLGWQPVEDVAGELASEFMRLLPRTKAGSDTNVTKAVDIVVGHAKGYRRVHGWGFVASNRCSNAVKWRVLEQGYPTDLAERLARALAIGMSQDR